MAAAGDKVISVVLGGGGEGDALASQLGVSSKALLPIEGRPMASFVLAALGDCAAVTETIYVGDASGMSGQVTASVPAGRGFAQSLALGMGAALALAPEGRILIVTADVPWLTAAAVDRFLAAGRGYDLSYPIVPAEVAAAAFPQQRRTYARLRQGRFTGGNLLSLGSGMVAPLLELIERAYRARKNPLALAGLVGPGTLVSFLLGRADLVRLESIVSDRLGGSAKAIVSEDACLAADVDRAEHVPQSIAVPL